MYRKYSRRAFDGLIKDWRLNLHVWSNKTLTPEEEWNPPNAKIELSNWASDVSDEDGDIGDYHNDEDGDKNKDKGEKKSILSTS
jgi:hypothetical protein